MSFTLVAETGSGVSGANSYATVANADTYFEGQIYKDSWIKASAAQKAQALAMATSTLDTLVSWDGTKKPQQTRSNGPGRMSQKKMGMP